MNNSRADIPRGRIRDLIEQAIDNSDARAAGEVADYLRIVKGFRYKDTFATVQRVRPNATLAEWDTLLSEADDLEAQS